MTPLFEAPAAVTKIIATWPEAGVPMGQACLRGALRYIPNKSCYTQMKATTIRPEPDLQRVSIYS